LGIIAGFVEQLVPSLLDDEAGRLRNGAAAGTPATDAAAPRTPGTTAPK